MSDETAEDGLRARLSRQGEEALGRFAQELLDNPLVSGALQRTFDARERAAQAQQAAMGALNLPSAADLERLTRRVRSVGQRLEGIEDGVDRLADRLARSDEVADDARLTALEQRLASLDDALGEVAASVSALAPAGDTVKPKTTGKPKAARKAKPPVKPKQKAPRSSTAGKPRA